MPKKNVKKTEEKKLKEKDLEEINAGINFFL